MPSVIPTFTSLGAGPTLLMLHDITGGYRAFAPQVESFASNGYRAVAWDMPGYGHSAPIEPYNFKGLAQSCITLIEGILQPRDNGSLILLGHGMGGMVAQEVMARRPELVKRLILCSTSAAVGPHEQDLAAREAWQKSYIDESMAQLNAGRSMQELALQAVPQMVGPNALPEGVNLAQHVMAQVPSATYRRALEALVTFDRQALLELIHVPTLLISGALDTAAPSDVMRQMANAIIGSSFQEMPGVGQLPQLEDPDTFDGLVLQFLADSRLLQ